MHEGSRTPRTEPPFARHPHAKASARPMDTDGVAVACGHDEVPDKYTDSRPRFSKLRECAIGR
jgi:hypothetical protein